MIKQFPMTEDKLLRVGRLHLANHIASYFASRPVPSVLRQRVTSFRYRLARKINEFRLAYYRHQEHEAKIMQKRIEKTLRDVDIQNIRRAGY